MKKIFFYITFLVTNTLAFGQAVDFWITQKYEKVDFYSERVQEMSRYMDSTGMGLDSVFAVKFGDYNIVNFERYIYGESIDGGYTFVRQVIVVKYNMSKTIIEGYFIPFGWKEYPITPVILKTNCHLKLKSGLDTDKMTFRHLDGYDEETEINLLVQNGGKLMAPSNYVF